ncbi:MAG: hypothetical protein QW687_01890 [Candidatus Hadarchaeales archaeon]
MGRIVLRKQEQIEGQSQKLPTVDEVLKTLKEKIDEFSDLVREKVTTSGVQGGREAIVEFLQTHWGMDEDTAQLYINTLLPALVNDDELRSKIAEVIGDAVKEWKEEEKSIQGKLRRLVRKELMRTLERLKKEISF